MLASSVLKERHNSLITVNELNRHLTTANCMPSLRPCDVPQPQQWTRKPLALKCLTGNLERSEVKEMVPGSYREW